jgi:hypothetical protein
MRQILKMSLAFSFSLTLLSGPNALAFTDAQIEAMSSKSLNLFYENALMPDGPFKGQKLDAATNRSAVLMDDFKNRKTLENHENYYLVGNFFHHGKLYIARIPKRGIEKMSLVNDYFTTKNLAAHVMVMYEYSVDNPVELIAEIPTVENLNRGVIDYPIYPRIKLHKILFSAEAVPLVGSEFSIKRGLNEELAIAYRFMSLSARMDSTKNKNRGRFEVLEIVSSDFYRANSLKRALTMADSHKMNSMYDTLDNNCVNSALIVINWPLRKEIGTVAEVYRLFPLRLKLEMNNPFKNRPRIQKSYEIERK